MPYAQIAIENGLKLMDNCFEKHRVNLDPSSSRSTTIVYRPIDKFNSPLPYLIGTDKWKEKWHLGLVEEDKCSQTGSTYAESIDSNNTKNECESSMMPQSSLMASQDSLAKSTSSIGEQMVINGKQSGGLFDEVYEEPKEEAIPSDQSQQQQASTFFRKQPPERKIVNLFDDEPPDDNDDGRVPSFRRKPVNLFDDENDSISIRSEIMEQQQPSLPLPPVDLFNENEFDDFIKRMERNQNRNQGETSYNDTNNEAKKEKVVVVKEEVANKKVPQVSVQRDMKIIADEIKRVQLKKAEDVKQPPPQTLNLPQSKVETVPKQQQVEKPSSVQILQKRVESEPEPKSKSLTLPIVKKRPRITNLFDDDDDEPEDFFDEIIKQKNSSNSIPKMPPVMQEQKEFKIKPVESKLPFEKKKITNLFDDEDEEDDAFENIFTKKSTSISVSTPGASDKHAHENTTKVVKRLFDESTEGHQTQECLPTHNADKQTTQLAGEIDKNNAAMKRETNLFDDHKINTDSKMGQELKKESEERKNVEEEKISNHDNLSILKEAKQAHFDDSENSDSSPVNEIIENVEVNNKRFEDKILSAKNNDKHLNNRPDDIVPNANLQQNSTATNIKQTSSQTISSFLSSSTSKDFNSTIPFLSELPPDDEDTWDTEDSNNNFEETETKIIKEIPNANAFGYSAIPLFNELPPDDDDFLSHSVAPPPLIPEPNFDDDEETIEKSSFEIPEKQLESFDESDRVVTATSNIKSKLDLFAKSQEIPVASQRESKKIPGKINSSLKINVNALMPGARLPIAKKTEELSYAREKDDNFNDAETIKQVLESNDSSSSTIDTSSVGKNNNSNLLNNEIAKSRAKIQVKRRPSTRRGRQSVYEKTLSVNIDENNEQKQDKDEEEEEKNKNIYKSTPINISKDAIETLAPKTEQSNLTQSIDEAKFNEPPAIASTNLSHSILTDKELQQNVNKMSIHEQLSNAQRKSNNFFTDEPPPLNITKSVDSAIQKVTTSKISVFYDDEDETKQMLEEQKRMQESNEHKKLSDQLFDNVEDDIFGEKNPNVESVQKFTRKDASQSKFLFEDDNNDDIFAKVTRPKNELAKQSQLLVKSKPLFEDEEDDDDALFGISKKSKTEIVKKPSKLFDSDEDQKGSIIFAKASTIKKKSLFGDDSNEEDDDDLFSSKPKTGMFCR